MQVLYSVFYGQQPRVPDDTPAAFRALLQVSSSARIPRLLTPTVAHVCMHGSKLHALSVHGSSWPGLACWPAIGDRMLCMRLKPDVFSAVSECVHVGMEEGLWRSSRDLDTWQ